MQISNAYVAKFSHNKKVMLGKTCYSQYSSCCHTDLQSHWRSTIFISSEQAYAIDFLLVINSNLGAISDCLATIAHTDHQDHPRYMIFMSFETQYVTYISDQ